MPDLIQARAWYSQNDLVHGYDHMLRVYRLAECLAAAEGADLEIVRAAALLHDASPPTGTTRSRQTHHEAAADFAHHILLEEGWSPDRIGAVCHAIRAHRFRDHLDTPSSLEAQVLFDADKLDAIGAIGVARALAFALQNQQPVYATPSQEFHQTGHLQLDEPHSAYHEYIYKLSKIKAQLYTAQGRRMATDRHEVMTIYFEQLAREYSIIS